MLLLYSFMCYTCTDSYKALTIRTQIFTIQNPPLYVLHPLWVTPPCQSWFGESFFKSTNAEALPSVFLIKLDRLVLEIIFLSFFDASNVLPGWKAGALTWAQVQRLLLKDLHFLQLNVFSYIGPWILKTFFFHCRNECCSEHEYGLEAVLHRHLPCQRNSLGTGGAQHLLQKTMGYIREDCQAGSDQTFSQILSVEYYRIMSKSFKPHACLECLKG